MTKKFVELDHPVLKHKLGYLRDKESTTQVFRETLKELSQLMAYEVMRDSNVERIDVKTPIAKAKVDRITKSPIVVSILRAGNTMQEAIVDIMPFCSAGHIGIYRDKFIHNTVEYYFKLPKNCEGQEILLVDPLMATGDTAVASLDRLKQYKVGKIKFMTVITCTQAVKKIHQFHPDVEIYTINLDNELTAEGYLIPGIGDAGDRLFKTK